MSNDESGQGGPQGAWMLRPGVPAQRPAAKRPSVAPPNNPAPSSPPPPHVVQALQAAQLFRSFTETGIQILASVAQEKILPRGTPLFVENMIGEALYVIVDGRVRVTVRGPSGADVDLVALGRGESLGEGALLRVGPRMCSAVADVDTRVLEISRRDIAQLQRTKPQACLKLMMGVAEVLGQRLKDSEPELRRFFQWRTGG